MSEPTGDQVHAATPARREQARRDGDVAKSFELAAAIQMIGAIAVAFFLLGKVGIWIRTWTIQSWSSAGTKLNIEAEDFTDQVQNAMLGGLGVLLPLMLLLLLVGVGSHWLQTGPMFLAGRVAPDPSRLASGSWRRQVFSLGSLAMIFVGIPKTLIACIAMSASAWVHRNEFFALAHYPIDVMAEKMFALIMTVTFQVAFALLVVSAADYWLKFVSHQRRIRMTDQQLRDELRMQNGDPQIHARRNQMNRPT